MDDDLWELRGSIHATMELIAASQRILRESADMLELARALSSPLIDAHPPLRRPPVEQPNPAAKIDRGH
jgi:hypothetical protein